MDKRRILTALFEGNPKQAEQALQTIREANEESANWQRSFEENLTVLEQSRYLGITESIPFKNSEPVLYDLSENELDELIDLTRKIENGLPDG